MQTNSTNGSGVTSYAEVWIEIVLPGGFFMRCTSPPTRRCGLKLRLVVTLENKHYVTSYAEVWIEITASRASSSIMLVTSYAEVWIEILKPRQAPDTTGRHLLRGGVD